VNGDARATGWPPCLLWHHTVWYAYCSSLQGRTSAVGDVHDQGFNRNSIKTHSDVSLWLTNHKAINRLCRVSSAHPAVSRLWPRGKERHKLFLGLCSGGSKVRATLRTSLIQCVGSEKTLIPFLEPGASRTCTTHIHTHRVVRCTDSRNAMQSSSVRISAG
jgi:hypothetical protein